MDSPARFRDEARRMVLEHAAYETFNALSADGVDVLLLKGLALRTLLYDSHEKRGYGDVDLLVDPHQWRRALQILADLGYRPEYVDFPHLSRSLHALTLVGQRAGQKVEIDLHHRLHAVQGSSAAAWEVLSTDPLELTVAGHRIRTTSMPVTLLHLAMCSLPQNKGTPRHHEELRRLVRLDPALVPAAEEIARRLHCVAPFRVGLALAQGDPAAGGVRLVHEHWLSRRLAFLLYAPDARDRWEMLRVAFRPAAHRARRERNRALARR